MLTAPGATGAAFAYPADSRRDDMTTLDCVDHGAKAVPDRGAR